ncbi:glycosyltransferase family 2 protein, partial [Paenibacillus sepulcri]|nr:glycosyltransferase family 2 protein [Paenibacillus sepulcri]
MNVFILNPEGRSLMAGITEETVIHEAPCWSIHKIEGHPGEFLNEAITWDAEPFFLTLLAGERMESGFQSELQSCLDELAFHHAGLCLSGDTAIRPGDDRHAASRGPVVWRKAAVLDAGGFAARDWLPFGGYVLYEMMHRLSADWSWREFPAARLRSQPISYSPSWRKEKDQWLRIAPLLKRDNSPVSPVEQDPIFSIVICTYNSADFLPWSIRSVFEQSFSSWELIIVDDGSGDATAEKLEQFLENPRVRLLRSEHNQGKSCC